MTNIKNGAIRLTPTLMIKTPHPADTNVRETINRRIDQSLPLMKMLNNAIDPRVTPEYNFTVDQIPSSSTEYNEVDRGDSDFNNIDIRNMKYKIQDLCSVYCLMK